MRQSPIVLVAVFAGLFAWGSSGSAEDSEASRAALRVHLQDGSVAVLTEGQDLYLEASPRRGEGLLSFARRFCSSGDAASLVAAENGGSQKLLAGIRYRIPFSTLDGNYQVQVVRGLFEDDRAVAEGWQHRVLSANGHSRESLWNLAEWFTGQGENYQAIRESNRLDDDDLAPGQMILVPANLLRPSLRSALPPSSPYHLQYSADQKGEFAIYRLKPGEALYSSVVVRFTGRVFAEDVNGLAREVAARSGIRDVTDIPIGYEVKVPFSLLLPEYLPAGHPKRQEYEQGLMASAQFSNVVTASRLSGVTVVLDAGHGGNDVGASVSGVWESLYVYDIMVRAMQILRSSTAASVIATTQDGRAHAVAQQDQLSYSKGHRVLTTPNYQIEDSRVGVHLRWYLSNSIYRQAVENGGDPDKVVFVSIHADSLHPSLRGAMVYIPGAKYRSGTYGKSGSVYASRREVKERPQVSYSSRERVKSEGLSRELASNILGAFHERGMVVHPDKPIREKVIRQRRAWVPAVLRYNAIPAEVLVEVCNLANAQDRNLIQTAKFRQQVAEAIVSGILSYYGQAEGDDGPRVAAAGR
ncbi:MAG: N-acetylmuramoyl-L-alanine amidase [Thermoanaerobaculia bacterium]